MHISLNQRWEKTANVNGFGYARQMCEESLVRLGHTVNFADSTADIEINFIQPEHWVWSGVDYRIAFLPWESTGLQEGWLEALNDVDEVWTPSEIIADWFVEAGVRKPVFVYHHGVDEVWTPYRRHYNNPLNVFHPDAGAVRKRSDLLSSLCLGRDDVKLSMKMIGEGVHPEAPGEATGFSEGLAERLGISLRKDRLSVEDLVSLYHQQNLMVYPTAGEGFGLSPIQALATGMPTIITKGWAPYEYLFDDRSLVETKLVDVPPRWRHLHPGRWLEADEDSLRAAFEWYLDADNYEQAAQSTFDFAPLWVDDWRWDVKTAEIMEHLL